MLSFQSAHSRKATISLLGPRSGAALWTRPLSPPSGSCPACLAPLRASSKAWCRQQSCAVALVFCWARMLLDKSARLACRVPPVLCCSLLHQCTFLCVTGAGGSTPGQGQFLSCFSGVASRDCCVGPVLWGFVREAAALGQGHSSLLQLHRGAQTQTQIPEQKKGACFLQIKLREPFA